MSIRRGQGNKLRFIQTAEYSPAVKRSEVALFGVDVSLYEVNVAYSQ